MKRKVYSTLLLLAVLVWLGFSNTWASSECLKLAKQKKFGEAGQCYQRQASSMKPGASLSKFEKSTKGRALRNGAFAYQKAAQKASSPRVALRYIVKARRLLQKYLNERLCSRTSRCNLVRKQLERFRSQRCILLAKARRYASAGRCYTILSYRMKSGPKLSKFARSTKGRLIRNAALTYQKASQATSKSKAARTYSLKAISLLRLYLNERLCTRSSRCNLVMRQLRSFRSKHCRLEAKHGRFLQAGDCYTNLAQGMSHGSRLSKFARSTKGRLLRNGAYSYQQASALTQRSSVIVNRLRKGIKLLEVYLDEALCNRPSQCERVKKQLLGFRVELKKQLAKQQALAQAKRRRPPPPSPVRVATMPPTRKVKVAARTTPTPRPPAPTPQTPSQRCLLLAKQAQYQQAGECYQNEANAMKPGKELNKFERSTKGRLLRNGAIAFQKASAQASSPQLASSTLQQGMALLRRYISERLCRKAYRCDRVRQMLLTMRSTSCGLFAKQSKFFRSGRCFRDLAEGMRAGASLSMFEKTTKGRLYRNGAYAFQKAAQKSQDKMLSSYQWEQGMKLLQAYLREGLCRKVSRCQLINEQIQQFRNQVQYVQVTIATQPSEPAYLSLEGFRFRHSVAFAKVMRKEIRPGQYTITVVKAGQPPVRKTINVDPSQSRSMNVAIPIQATNLALLQPAPMPNKRRRRRRMARVQPQPNQSNTPPAAARTVPQPKVAVAPKTDQPPSPQRDVVPPPVESPIEPVRQPPPPREPEPREPAPPQERTPGARKTPPREIVPEPVPDARRPAPPVVRKAKQPKKPEKPKRKKPVYPLTNTGGYVFLGVGSAVVAMGAVAAIAGYMGTGSAVDSIPSLQQQAQALDSEGRRQLALRDQRALSLRSQYNGSQSTFRDGLIVGGVGLAAVVVGIAWVAVVNSKAKKTPKPTPPPPQARAVGKGAVGAPSWSNSQTLYVSP